MNSFTNYLQKNNIKIDVTIHDRTIMPIPYGHMPSFLGNYSVYVDIKIVNGQLLESLRPHLKLLLVTFKYFHMT